MTERMGEYEVRKFDDVDGLVVKVHEDFDEKEKGVIRNGVLDKIEVLKFEFGDNMSMYSKIIESAVPSLGMRYGEEKYRVDLAKFADNTYSVEEILEV